MEKDQSNNFQVIKLKMCNMEIIVIAKESSHRVVFLTTLPKPSDQKRG